MDPVTHTLVGASLASTSLGDKTRLAVPAFIIGANLPDLDVFSYFAGADFAIGFRRGWTHGVLALVLLPLLLAAALRILSRLRPPTAKSPPLSTKWLVAICYLAVLTHPFLDWLNTYGMRWFMPFSDTWYYGDSVFIVDPWLWMILGTGWLAGKKASPIRLAAWLIPAAYLVYSLRDSRPEFIPALIAVFAVIAAAHIWKPPTDPAKCRRAALIGLSTGALFVGLLLSIHAATKKRVYDELDRMGIQVATEMMVGPTPTNPLVWDVVVGLGKEYRYGQFRWSGDTGLRLTDAVLPAARRSSLWDEIKASGQLPGYLSWIRFPWYEVEIGDQDRRVHLIDARYRRSRTKGFGGATIVLPGTPASH